MSEQLVFDLGRGQDDHFVMGRANQNARDAIFSSKILLINGTDRAGKTGICRYAMRVFQGENLSSVAMIEAHIKSAKLSDVLIDDVDLFIKLPHAQTALFHLYNLIKAQDQRLIMFCKTLPSGWGIELADLKSRIESLPIAIIDAPDDAMIFELLANGFHARGVLVSNDLIAYILKRVERSYAKIEEAIDQLDARARAENGKVSRALVIHYFGGQNE